MTLRQKIQTYTTHGGAWKHLEEELIKQGMSKKLSEYYVSKISKKLDDDEARKALSIFDLWKKNKNEQQVESTINLLFL